MTTQEKLYYYLLVQRANPPDQGKWSLPGGKIHVGESTLRAAQRELTEETQLAAADCLWHPHPFMTSDAIVPRTNGDNNDNDKEEDEMIAFHYLIAQCFGQAPDGLPVITPCDDALDAKWWTLLEIQTDLTDTQQVSNGVMDVIRRAEELQIKDVLPLRSFSSSSSD